MEALAGLLVLVGMFVAALARIKRRARRVFRPNPAYRKASPSRPVQPYKPKTKAGAVPNLDRTLLIGKCWVVDGDTIRIGHDPIRLAGIDTPELDHPYGEQAKWALVRLCKGQTVRAEIIAGETSHDRYVARCYLPDGRDLAAALVRAGLAIDWPKFSGGRYAPLEVPGVRKKLWRCDARQKGRLDETPLGARIAAQRQRRGDDLELIEPDA